ncbi:MAG: DUF1566 domain-containing protein, partial [Pseudomonadales bacterium]|nr:DUF1566 domain-containing protein [Pseudomonadales bacterium]
MNKHHTLSALALLLAISHSHAQTCNANIARTAPDSRYELVNNGTEVKDTQTNLIWQRCSLGQTWNGSSCTGTAATYNWTNALQTAANMGSGWHLPNIKELSSLVERACYNASINETYFPNTISGYYWSSSPVPYNSNYAWFVNFSNGSDNHHGYKGNNDYVRLVR